MCKKIFFVLVTNLVTFHSIYAQCLGSCCCAANISGNSQAMNTPAKGELIIGANLLTMQYQPLSEDELLQWAQPDIPVFSVASQWTASGTVMYGISKKFAARLSLPYNYSTQNLEGHLHTDELTEIHTYGSIRGVGDGSVFLNYQFLDKSEKGWKAFVGAGIKIPTGTTSALSTYNVVLPVHLQPGTGSWDPIVQVAAEKKWNRFGVQSQLFGRLATTALEHNMGDYARVDVNALYDVIPSPKKVLTALSISGGLIADHNAKMKFAEDHDHDGTSSGHDTSSALITFPNSGFTRLFAQATVKCTIAKHVIVPLQFSVPVWQDLGGHQASLQWTASVGLFIELATKKSN